MTDVEPTDLLDLAEAVAAGRLTVTDAEARLRSRPGIPGRMDAEVAQLHSLVNALGAVDAHARATGEVMGQNPATPPVISFDDIPSMAVGGVVRRRAPQRPGARSGQRPVLVLAAALLLGVGLAAASFIGGRLANQGLQPSSTLPIAFASPSARDHESTPPASDAASQAPPSPRQGTVRALLWTLSEGQRIDVMSVATDTRRMPTLFSIDTWPDPDKASGSVIARQVLASPQGRYVAIAETNPRAPTRLRVVTIKGQVVWSDESANGIPSLAWSADGAQLAIAFAPEPWLVLNVGGPTMSAREYQLPSGSALKLVGFSPDGRSLVGYEGTGEAAPWEQPRSLDLASGEISRLQAFPAIAASNTTTVAPRVDPLTGRVLDPGGLAGTEANWGMYAGQRRVELELPVSTRRTLIDPRWTDTGTILVLQTPIDDKPPSNSQQDPVLQLIREPGPGARPEKIADASWAFSGPKGTRCRGALLEARDGRVLIGLATYPSDDQPWMGFDEINLIDLTSGGMVMLSVGGLAAFDIHSAGLID
jgi:hypothetical protein